MAEFCRDCWNKYHKNDPARNYVLSPDLDLCEGCGEMKRIVLYRKTNPFSIDLLLFFLDVVWKLICFLISLPIKLYNHIKAKKK